MPGVSCGGSGGRYLSGGNANTPVSAARWSVPIDDTHTLLMRVRFKPADNPGQYEGDPFSQRWKPPRDFIVPYKEYRDSDQPVLGYDIPPLHFIEDGMVVDSMPPVADRENENLGPTIDDGIIKLRQMYLREIEKVKRGEDPKAIVRDPEKNKMIVIPAYEKWVPESERQAAKNMAVG
jgi:5,5'-dehydrodivanillate O-demethylase oxygenase subunit